MKFKRISQEQAEQIIVYGKGAGFSIIKIIDQNYTIYHRVYDDKYYDIAQLSIYDNVNDQTIDVFYMFDPDGVKAILGVDPEIEIRKAIVKEGL